MSHKSYSHCLYSVKDIVDNNLSLRLHSILCIGVRIFIIGELLRHISILEITFYSDETAAFVSSFWETFVFHEKCSSYCYFRF